MRRRGFISALCSALVALALAGPAAAQGYPNPHYIVEVDWLKSHYEDPGLRIVDMRSPDAYVAGHIPGAVYLSVGHIRSTVDGVAQMMSPPEAVSEVLAEAGISNDVRVIAYGNYSGVAPARLFWTLQHLGHDEVAVLNGGFAAWRAAGGPLSTEVTKVARATFTPQVRRDAAASAEWIKDHLGDPSVLPVDARSPGEYNGEIVKAKRGGHIPGAVNVNWTEALAADGRLKPPEVLRALYEGAGASGDKTLMPYCQSHMRGSHTYWVLKVMGFEKVRGYDGSWIEWGNRDDLPIEK